MRICRGIQDSEEILDMKIVWLSANMLGYEVLKESVKSGLITAIITLKNEAKTVMYDGINNHYWHSFGIPVYEIKNINEEKELLEKLSPDYVMVCGWRQIISKDILQLQKMKFIGFHPTPLPEGRGPAPIINTILKGMRESALTLFYMTEGLDDGDIIFQKRFDIAETDHAMDVYKKIISIGKENIMNILEGLRNNSLIEKKQDASKASTFQKPSLKDNKIDAGQESIEDIYRKIKALSKPYRGAYIEQDGKKLIIWRAELR